jgi:hypothetical protein
MAISASSILSAFTDQAAFTAINELDGQVIWALLGVKNVQIMSDAGQSEQPISNIQNNNSGTYNDVITNDINTIKVIRPARVTVTALCSDISTIEAVMSSFADTTLTISINTKSNIITNLAISSLEIEQNGNMLSAAEIKIELEQAEPPYVPPYNPLQPADASQYGIKIQTLNTSTFSLASLEAKVAEKIVPPVAPIIGALLGSHGEPFMLGTGNSMLS